MINLQTPAARRKLAWKAKPYVVTIERGVALGYRVNKKGPNTWAVRLADGDRSANFETFAVADDEQSVSAGETVLSYAQAHAEAVRLSKLREPKSAKRDEHKIETFSDAVGAYERFLSASGRCLKNSKRIRANAPAWLAAKRVRELTITDFENWVEELRTRERPAQPDTIVRLGKVVKAALNYAAVKDPRISNAKAWKLGFKGVKETRGSRNAQVISDAQVQAVMAACYQHEAAFGLYVQVVAETGARPSQVSKLNVGDLEFGKGGHAYLMMPPSLKGHKLSPQVADVPITAELARRLREASAGRAADEPLLLRRDGRRWQDTSDTDYAERFKIVAKRLVEAGVLDKLITIYALRHSAIVRWIFAGVTMIEVAKRAETSIGELQKTYALYITRHRRESGDAPLGLLIPLPRAA